MSDIFLSYRFTGECPKELDYVLGGIKNSLEEAGHNVLCSFFWEDEFQKLGLSRDEIYDVCLERQVTSDTFMALIKSYDKSSGMDMEKNKARDLGQKFVLLEKEGIYIPEFREASNRIINFYDYSNLFEQLKFYK